MIVHAYALWSWQPVATSCPPAENDTQDTVSACLRGELIGWLLSRFHNRTVLSCDALAKMRSCIAMALIPAVCSFRPMICSQVEVFHVLIQWSADPDISSAPQARQDTVSECPLRAVIRSPVLASQTLTEQSPGPKDSSNPPVANLSVSGE